MSSSVLSLSLTLEYDYSLLPTMVLGSVLSVSLMLTQLVVRDSTTGCNGCVPVVVATNKGNDAPPRDAPPRYAPVPSLIQALRQHQPPITGQLRRARYHRLMASAHKLREQTQQGGQDTLLYRNQVLYWSRRRSKAVATIQYHHAANEVLPTIFDDDWSEDKVVAEVPQQRSLPVSGTGRPAIYSGRLRYSARVQRSTPVVQRPPVSEFVIPSFTSWSNSVVAHSKNYHTGFLESAVAVTVPVPGGKRRRVCADKLSEFAVPSVSSWSKSVAFHSKNYHTGFLESAVAITVPVPGGKRRRVCVDDKLCEYVVPSVSSWSKSVQYHSSNYHIGFVDSSIAIAVPAPGGKRRRVCVDDKLSSPPPVVVPPPPLDEPFNTFNDDDEEEAPLPPPVATTPSSDEPSDEPFNTFDDDDEEEAPLPPPVATPPPSDEPSDERLGSVFTVDGVRRSARVQERQEQHTEHCGSVLVNGVRRSARLLNSE